MEKNKFEKQVAEKMADLSFRPSEKVWAEVSSRIRPSGSRKKAVLFLLLFFVFSGIASIFLWQNKKHTISDNRMETRQFNRNGLTKPGVGVTQNEELSQMAGSEKLINGKVPEHSIADSAAPKQAIIDRNNKLSGVKDDISFHQKPATERAPQHHQLNPSARENRSLAPESGTSVVKTEIDEFISVHDVAVFETAAANLTEQKRDLNIENQILPLIAENPDLDHATRKIKKQPLLQRWNVAVNFSVGKPFLSKDLLPEKSFRYSDLYSPVTNVSFGVPPVVNVPAPKLSAATSYRFGITAGKDLSKRIKLSSGLSYSYHSIFHEPDITGYLGPQNTSATAKKFKNAFHYLELPLQITLSLWDHKNTALEVEGGGFISGLIYANSFQYDQGRYISDHSYFRQMQFGLSGGISMKIFQHFHVGPEIQYRLNPLSNKGLYNQKHLNFIGIKSGFSF